MTPVLAWSWQTFPYSSNEVCCHKTSLNSVDHVAEIFSPLLQGIPLALLSIGLRANLDIIKMLDEIEAYRVSRIVLVPSFLHTLLQQEINLLDKLKNLRYVFCSGELLSTDLKEQFCKLLPWVDLVNLYGSSEVSADVTYYHIPSQKENILINYFIDGLSKIKMELSIPETI